MKVTMVGTQGSGKTAFMSGLYHSLGENKMSGFHITPAGNSLDEAVILQGKFQSLSLPNRNFEFPPGTQKSTLWNFDLRYYDRLVGNYEWIDYRGGILTDITSDVSMSDQEKRKDVSELISHITLSNAVILFANSLMLTYYDNINQARHRSGASIINGLFETYNQFLPNRNLIFVIALTKADAVEEKWKVNNYAPLIQRGLEAFAPIVNICKRNRKWIGGIVPISVVGEGNANIHIEKPLNIQTPVIAKTDIVNFPTPMNTGHVMFFCLGQTLKLMQEIASTKIEQYEQDIESALGQSGVGNDLWSFLTGKSSARDIAKELMNQRGLEYSALRKFETYVDPLYMSALEKVNRV